jgi:hypothetical protein
MAHQSIHKIVLVLLVLALVFPPAGIQAAPLAKAATAFSCATASGLPTAECEALVALYNATGGSGWFNQTGWLQTNTPCTWYGVSCKNERVTGLALNNQRLSGALPAQISALTALEALYLDNNQLVSIPPQIGSLSSLRYLSLGNNHLTSLPVEIGNLTFLRGLRVSENELNSLPLQIGNLSLLSGLNLENNQLSVLPVEIGSLLGLETLTLWNNQLISLPDEIGALVSLRHLYLNDNQLTALPAGIGYLGNLRYLDVSHNQLAELPAGMGSLLNLNAINLTGNQLTDLPDEFSSLTNLQYLRLGENQLSSLPSVIPDLANLDMLSLHGNPLSGELPSSLTALSLNEFTFYDTQWCVPHSGDTTTWLGTIPFIFSSGWICETWLGGGLSGTVTLPGGAPAAGVQVNLYRSLEGGVGRFHWYTVTDSEGKYGFNQLGEGIGVAYKVQFVDRGYQYAPQFYADAYHMFHATPVNIPLGSGAMDIDMELTLAFPAAAVIYAPAASVSRSAEDGVLWINFPHGKTSDITVTREITCPSGMIPLDVSLNMAISGYSFPMANVFGSSWRAAIPVEKITEEDGLYIMHQCSGVWTQTVVGYINFFTPLGAVIDASSEKPIHGAKVTLYRVPGWLPKTGPDDTREKTCQSNASKAADAPWSWAAPLDAGILPNKWMGDLWPEPPVQMTAPNGEYGWELGPGCYYVYVEARGYNPSPSMFFGSEPEVTDMNVKLYIRERYLFLPLLNRR